MVEWQMRSALDRPALLLAVCGTVQVVLIVGGWCWVAVKCKFLYWDEPPPITMLLVRDHGWLLFAIPAAWAAWCLKRAGSTGQAGDDALSRNVGLVLVVVIALLGFFTGM